MPPAILNLRNNILRHKQHCSNIKGLISGGTYWTGSLGNILCCNMKEAYSINRPLPKEVHVYLELDKDRHIFVYIGDTKDNIFTSKIFKIFKIYT